MGTKSKCEHRDAILKGDVLVCTMCRQVILPDGMEPDELGLNQLRVLIAMLETLGGHEKARWMANENHVRQNDTVSFGIHNFSSFPARAREDFGVGGRYGCNEIEIATTVTEQIGE